MIFYRLGYLFSALLYLFSTAVLSANTLDSKDLLKTEFSVVTVDGRVPVGVFFMNEKGVEVPVILNSATRSPVYSYVGPQRMLLWRKSDTEGRVPFAAVNLSPEHKRPLILLVENAAATPGQASHQAMAVEDSLANAPLGSLRFHNLTGGDMAMELAGKQTRLGSGPSAPFIISSEPSATPPYLRLASLRGDDVRIIYQGKIIIGPQERVTMIIVSGPSPEANPRLRILRELAKPVAKVPKDKS